MNGGGQGALPEGEARDVSPSPNAIREMFDEISPKYDLVNHLLSFGRDIKWRKRAVQALGVQNTDIVLDIACGTGDMLSVIKATAPACLAVGGDFSIHMLRCAVKKGIPARLTALDACALPFASNSFDKVTMAFGFRNIPNKPKALEEAYRTLKPGGMLGILEFSKPKTKLFSSMYWFYFKYIFPLAAALIAGNKNDYAYLPSSVRDFPDNGKYLDMVGAAGFTNAKLETYDLGICSLLTAKKAAPR
jgi:demethylmenaquinone methyltransferase/2-methoxy-6-polyprenyl-1,4-benzoquinol methylase